MSSDLEDLPDMPQPLRKWIDGIRFTHETLAQRPELAAGISRVSAIWCEIDVELGMIMAILLGTQAYIGVSMYLALSGSPAQRAALMAAATAVNMPDYHQTLLQEVITEMRIRASERNRVVHALWSLHPNSEKLIICCQPENIVKTAAKAASSIASSEPFDKFFDVFRDEPSSDFIAELRCYGLKDFEDIIARIHVFKEQVTFAAASIGTYFAGKRSRPNALQAIAPPFPGTESPPEDSRTNQPEQQ